MRTRELTQPSGHQKPHTSQYKQALLALKYLQGGDWSPKNPPTEIARKANEIIRQPGALVQLMQQVSEKKTESELDYLAVQRGHKTPNGTDPYARLVSRALALPDSAGVAEAEQLLTTGFAEMKAGHPNLEEAANFLGTEYKKFREDHGNKEAHIAEPWIHLAHGYKSWHEFDEIHRNLDQADSTLRASRNYLAHIRSDEKELARINTEVEANIVNKQPSFSELQEAFAHEGLEFNPILVIGRYIHEASQGVQDEDVLKSCRKAMIVTRAFGLEDQFKAEIIDLAKEAHLMKAKAAVVKAESKLAKLQQRFEQDGRHPDPSPNSARDVYFIQAQQLEKDNPAEARALYLKAYILDQSFCRDSRRDDIVQALADLIVTEQTGGQAGQLA